MLFIGVRQLSMNRWIKLGLDNSNKNDGWMNQVGIRHYKNGWMNQVGINQFQLKECD